MYKIRILHTADLHLGSPFSGSGFDSDKIKERKRDLFECFDSILVSAQKKKVDLVIICGDLFEEDRVKRSDINSIMRSLSGIAPIRCVILPGNHDHFRAGGYYDWIHWPANVYIFKEREFTSFVFEDISLAVYGSAFTSPEDPEGLIPKVKLNDKNKFRILAFHGSLIMKPDTTDPYRPFTEAELSALGADYIALGHYHKPAVYKNEKGRIIASYPGSPEPLNFGEIFDHSFNIVTIDDKGVSIETIPSARRSYYKYNAECGGMKTEKDVVSACRKVAADASEKDIIRFVLKGSLQKGLKFDRDVIAAELRKHFFWVKVEDATCPDIDIESISLEQTTRGLFVRQMLDMMEESKKSAETEKTERLSDALYYGLAALDGKRPEKR
jgi:exonuclease SbcD